MNRNEADKRFADQRTEIGFIPIERFFPLTRFDDRGMLAAVSRPTPFERFYATLPGFLQG